MWHEHTYCSNLVVLLTWKQKALVQEGCPPHPGSGFFFFLGWTLPQILQDSEILFWTSGLNQILRDYVGFS